MNDRVNEILKSSMEAGWVLEPLAKELLGIYGLTTTKFAWAKTPGEAQAAAQNIGFPLVVKVVSHQVLHKSDVGGVVVGVKDSAQLDAVFFRLSELPGFEGVLLDEMAAGAEVILGSKQDPQFGPVVLIGIGGTSVEIYKDVSIRMAPLSAVEALQALHALKGRRLLEGYRGRTPVNTDHLTDLIARFSQMVFELADHIESIDLNPVLCGAEKAVIADARIMIKR